MMSDEPQDVIGTPAPDAGPSGAPALSRGRRLRIVYFANCWMTNVGEAFIDIGAVELLKQAVPDSDVLVLTPMSFYYSNALRVRAGSRVSKEECDRNTAFMGRYVDADVFVMSGMFATEEFVTKGEASYWVTPFLEAHPGVKLLLMGVGGEKYTEAEVLAFSRYIQEKASLAAFISRDDQTYRLYADTLPECSPGIDCAFFVGDAYCPTGFASRDYIVATFHRMPEPGRLASLGIDIIRPEHMVYGATFDHLKPNAFISDTPHDYLSLYANAKQVHTDLVHATIVSLTYGIPVRYYRASKRAQAFAAAGATEDEGSYLVLPRDTLAQRKARMVSTVRRALVPLL